MSQLCELWGADIKTGDVKVVWAEETMSLTVNGQREGDYQRPCCEVM